MKKILFILLFCFISLTVNAQADWTVLMYMVADDDNYEEAEAVINELELVGSDSDMHIVALLDKWDDYEWEYVGDGPPVRVEKNRGINSQHSKSTSMYYIEENSDIENINSKVMTEMDNIQSGDPVNLASFIALNQNLFPARNYMVILWGVGSGFNNVPWKEDMSQFVAGYELGRIFQVALDNMLNQNKENIDLVFFDSAFMANYELSYELSMNRVDALAGPQGNMIKGDFPYKETLEEIKNTNRNLSGLDAAKLMGEGFINNFDGEEETQLSVINLRERAFMLINQRIDDLVDAIMADEKNYEKLHAAADRTLRYYNHVYMLDMVEFMANIELEFEDVNNKIKTAASMVKSHIESTGLIGFNQTTGMRQPTVGGLSIYFPLYRRADNDNDDDNFLVRPYSIDKEEYEKSIFAENTRWNELIQDYYDYMNNLPDETVEVEPEITIVTPVAQSVGASSSDSVSESSSDDSSNDSDSNDSTSTYTVKSGDNLTHIAQAHGMTVNQLAQLNNMSVNETLHVGTVLKVDSDGASSTSASETTQVNVTSSSSSDYIWPTSSRRITSPYGHRTHPITGKRKMHWGIDIGAPTGHEIISPANGRITHRAYSGGAGNMMIVNHGAGRETVYMHMHNFSVSHGQSVSSGQRIGSVGTTGASTGPHLHFETRKNDQRLDPMPRLP
ncbi:MAG: peptidoglycan DD-metalloendopeptidase family protein [Candidatus Muiribacteriota bacterium]